jgi:glycosyltransferase involved in cell wall biosynthesis
MKVGIYDRWFTALGGGERMVLALADCLAVDHEVEVLAHHAVDLDMAAIKLNVGTHRFHLRCVPELPDEQLSPLTADYDLFIAASQATFIPARARHNWMLVFFPYPIALPPAARFRRRVGEWLRQILHVPIYARGFYGREDDARWTDGNAALKIPLSTGRLNVRLLVGVPVLESAVRLDVNVNGQAVKAVDVLPAARYVPIDLVLSAGPDQLATIELISEAHPQPIGTRDARSIGVAVRAVQIDHWRYRLYEYLFEQRFKHWGLRLLNVPSDRGAAALQTYSEIVGISRFTQTWIKRYWSRDSELLYPPVEVGAFQPGDKRNIILTVGRIFAGGHNKKHLPMIGVFKQLVDAGLRDWEFHIAGSVGQEGADRDHFRQIQAAAHGYPIFVHADISQAELRALYASAKIYWHASGYGEDERRDPIKFEHFGITTVEAMAAGVVPIVLGKAGQLEIVEPERSGLQWRTLGELAACTRRVIEDQQLWSRLNDGARQRSRSFSREAFNRRVRDLISELM